MTRQTTAVSWTLLHAAPLLMIPIVTGVLHPAIGINAAASVLGLLAAGTVFGVVQAPAQSMGRRRWILAGVGGWMLGAAVFRAAIDALAGWSIGGFSPYALAYNSGHNELIWTAIGLACYGIVTAACLPLPRSAPAQFSGPSASEYVVH